MINWFERKPIRNWTFTWVKVEKKNKAKEGKKNDIRVNFNPMLVKCIKIMSNNKGKHLSKITPTQTSPANFWN